MEYLLQVKLGCLFGLLLLTLLFGLVPSRVKCFREGLEREAHQRWISFISCLAGGVFLAACLLDIIPDFLNDMKEEMINQQIKTDFPLPEFILGTGFLIVLIVERIVLDCSETMSEETTPLLSGGSNSPARQEQPHGHSHSHSGHHNDVEHRRHHFHVDFHAHSSFRSFILLLSLSLHSIFEGIAIGLQNVQSEVLQIAIAILIHKSIIAVSLSLLLLQSSVQTRWFVLSIVMFALMSPLGIGIGIGVMHNQTDGNRMVQCVLEGLAAGTFVYITFLEILPHELNSNKWRLPKVIFILLGFSGMAALRFLG
ncbi:solute carrier family 39 member 1 like [Xenopus tropicalis]|uniref:Solute carrier family 39 (Zinc transporter), member 1 n=1 Tax=Xenopus tropicalis TaxID=8364 RepID=Q28E43_XENTR|nr:solute carrier family 39 member 1 like [Xenopus tropicalis]AAI21997.1 solute carrier family 39 (zinc transporter), member 1 [Xenopus tropicalis]CAJ81800.1 solute carrier family 39 (zinc transporter), member 1 [Xenopus tropicalis]|eukprot:NP_001015957.1 solute carrier family 39 (zinc transporter), member 1 [Xenopus tropicalis]